MKRIGRNRILPLAGLMLVVSCGGPPDGPFETYYEGGQLVVRGTYKDGEIDGPLEIYLDNGQLWEKTTYKGGVQEGLFESYHENGEVRDKGMYKDNEKCGEWLEWGETVTYDPC